MWDASDKMPMCMYLLHAATHSARGDEIRRKNKKLKRLVVEGIRIFYSAELSGLLLFFRQEFCLPEL
jgi:hypothetical protein